jgi:hypothetical protein
MSNERMVYASSDFEQMNACMDFEQMKKDVEY